MRESVLDKFIKLGVVVGCGGGGGGLLESNLEKSFKWFQNTLSKR